MAGAAARLEARTSRRAVVRVNMDVNLKRPDYKEWSGNSFRIATPLVSSTA
jgi:hypothetical protein